MNNRQPLAITISVRDQTGENTYFNVSPSTEIGLVKQAFCERKGIAIEKLRFLFDGEGMNPDAMISDFDIKEGGQVDAMLEQRGGCVASSVPATFGTLAADGAHQAYAGPGSALGSGPS